MGRVGAERCEMNSGRESRVHSLLEEPNNFDLVSSKETMMDKTGQQGNKAAGGKPAAKRKRDNSTSGLDGPAEVASLKKQIAHLETENRKLRNQIAVLTDSMNRSSQSLSDSVREQQHNFFKYSNVRR